MECGTHICQPTASCSVIHFILANSIIWEIFSRNLEMPQWLRKLADPAEDSTLVSVPL